VQAIRNISSPYTWGLPEILGVVRDPVQISGSQRSLAGAGSEPASAVGRYSGGARISDPAGGNYLRNPLFPRHLLLRRQLDPSRQNTGPLAAQGQGQEQGGMKLCFREILRTQQDRCGGSPPWGRKHTRRAL